MWTKKSKQHRYYRFLSSMRSSYQLEVHITPIMTYSRFLHPSIRMLQISRLFFQPFFSTGSFQIVSMWYFLFMTSNFQLIPKMVDWIYLKRLKKPFCYPNILPLKSFPRDFQSFTCHFAWWIKAKSKLQSILWKNRFVHQEASLPQCYFCLLCAMYTWFFFP